MLAGGASAAAPVSTSGLCPKTKPDEIVVCATPDPPPSRYRLPLRATAPEFGTRASASVSAERNGLFDFDAGGSGLCGTVGPGGMYGCRFKGHRRMTEQRANASDVRGRVYDAPGN